uniref:Uncharacterized protein n=1 Tax=Eucampia antarctica TaxID=49252 RepID=A0A7S2W2X4_9STRA|mmetsp:Transcript_19417/g.18664  ORF Transcript_19417/g.18664 Transcript_19417/m.18664 type:complete len:245 (+) Transcript_19417:110-844(+)
MNNQIKSRSKITDLSIPNLDDDGTSSTALGNFRLKPRTNSGNSHLSCPSTKFHHLQRYEICSFLEGKHDPQINTYPSQDDTIHYIPQDQFESPSGPDFIPELLLPLSTSALWGDKLTIESPCHLSVSTPSSIPQTISSSTDYTTPQSLSSIEKNENKKTLVSNALLHFPNDISYMKDTVERCPPNIAAKKAVVSRAKDSKFFSSSQYGSIKLKYRKMAILSNDSKFQRPRNKDSTFNTFTFEAL